MEALRNTEPARRDDAPPAPAAPSRAARRDWAGFVSGLVEQGLFAASGLAVQVGVARAVAPDGYGAFAVASAVLLAGSAVHQAFFAEPMVVFSARQQADEFRRYLGRLSAATLSVALPVSTALACAAATASTFDRPLAGLLAGLSLALPGSLLFGLLRRAAYARGRTRAALAATSSQATAALPVLLGVGGDLAGPAALLFTGAGGIAGAALLAAALGVRPRRPATWRALSSVAKEHAAFGGWMAAAGLAHALAGLALLPLVGAVSGLQAAGVLRANQLLFAPAQQGLAVFGLFLGARSASLRVTGGETALAAATRTHARRNAGLALGYTLLAVVSGPPLLERLTGRPEYTTAGLWLTLPLGLALVAQAAAQANSLALRAREEPRRVFFSKGLALIALLLCTPLVWRFGAVGGACGLLVAAGAELLTVRFEPAGAPAARRVVDE